MTLNFNTSEVLLKQDLFASLSHNAGTNTDRNEFIVNWNLQYLRDQYRNHRVFLCLQNGIFIQRVTNDNANNNKSLIFTADNLRFKNRKSDINFFYGVDEPNILTFLRMGNRPVVNANREAENDHNIGMSQMVYELESIPDGLVTFKIKNSGKTNGVRELALQQDGSAIFQFIDLHFVLYILKEKNN
jgi:hypothetical protein